MNESTLDHKLSNCDMEVQDFVTALKKENLKLTKKIARLQAELVTERNRIGPVEPPLTDEELDKRIDALLKQREK